MSRKLLREIKKSILNGTSPIRDGYTVQDALDVLAELGYILSNDTPVEPSAAPIVFKEFAGRPANNELAIATHS